MPTMNLTRSLAALAAACAVLAAGRALAQPGGDDAAKRLASERGCSLCHAAVTDPAQAHSAAVTAPSWAEIAKRNRGKPDAEERLVRTVLGGSDPGRRHWPQAAFMSMLPNQTEVTPEEARTLVRWILQAD